MHNKKFTILFQLIKYKKSSLLILSALFANFCNFLYNAYLSRVSGFTDFGVVSLIGSFLSLTQIPLSSYTRSITHTSAYRYGKEKIPAADLWVKLRRNALKPTILLLLAWIVSVPTLMTIFRTPDIIPYILFTPIWAIGVTASVDSGFLGGSLKFQTLAIMTIIEAVLKLALTIILVQLGHIRFVYLAIPLSAIGSFTYGWYKANRIAKIALPNISQKATNLHISSKFFISSMFSKITTLAFLNMDVLLVKHYLHPEEAGKYALLSTIGKMVYFLGSLFTQFITPVISHKEGKGESSNKTFEKLMVLTIMVTFIAVCIFGLFGQYTSIMLFGNRAVEISQYLPLYTFGMACIVCAGAIAGYHQAKRNHVFSFHGSFVAVGMLIAISIYHDSIESVSSVVSYAGIFWLISTLLLHGINNTLHIFFRNIFDFISVFLFSPSSVSDDSLRLRVLIFNWRDTRHIWAGGAEVYIHELAKRLVNKGHTVTVFCGNDGKCPQNEIIDGVRIVRRGGFYTVYLWASIYYILKFKNSVDIVIESMNGIPFFSPLYASVPICLMVHHVHQEVFRKHLPFPFSYLAMFIELKIMPLIYKKHQIITVSESSKKEIVRHHLAERDRVTVITPGVSQINLPIVQKNRQPLVSYIGRLKPYKNVDTFIYACSLLIKKHNEVKIVIAGWGESEDYLKKLAKNLHIDSHISFKGYINEKEKLQLMGMSWVCVQPSSIEGWGITVIEANSMRTPVIGSYVHGLKDSIVDNVTGYLVPVKNIYAFNNAIEKVLSNRQIRVEMEKQAKQWSENFDWDVSTDILLSLIKQEIILSENRSIATFSINERTSI